MFYFSEYSVYGLEEIWVIRCSIFFLLPLVIEIYITLHWLSISGTGKILLESDQGCRVAVEPLEFYFSSGWRTPCAWDRYCGEETSYVPAKVVVVSFALLLVHSIKESGRIHCLSSRNMPIIHKTLTVKENEHGLHIWSTLLCFLYHGEDFDFHYESHYFVYLAVFPIL